jgi:hypothetical protein
MTEQKLLTRESLVKDGFKKSHTSKTRGYVRVGTETIVAYKGRFGEGFKVFSNNKQSSQYCFVTYYVK